MKCNVALWDRILRFILGLFLTSWAIAGGPFWAYVGVIFIATSSWGFCPVYAFFKISTLKLPNHRSNQLDE